MMTHQHLRTVARHAFQVALILCSAIPLQAQERWATRSGSISFFSETPMENIEAHNRKVSCVWDASTGAVELAVLIKAFEFEKALMQEHFNENYMESNKFPKATFKGTISGAAAAELARPGTYRVQVRGDLTMHGVTRQVEHPGVITVDNAGKVSAASDFVVRPEDHAIKVPGVVRNNIAEQIMVKVRLSLERL